MPTQESRIHEFQEEQTKVVLIQGQQGSNQYNGQMATETITEEIITRDNHTNQNQQVRESSSILYKNKYYVKK